MTRRVPLRGEEGIALAVAMLSLMLMVVLGGVALQQAVSALRHTTRETQVKRALEAADAAIEDATFAVGRADIGNSLDINVLNPTSVVNQNCVVSGNAATLDLATLTPGTPADPAGKRWCPETISASQTTSDGATYSYRVSELVRAGAAACGVGNAINLDRDVVGVGVSGRVVRRVKAHLNASLALLSGAAVQAAGTGTSPTAALTMANTAQILGSAQSNGSITATGVNVISGNATPGQNGTVSGVIPGGSTTKACQNFAIPEVDPGASATVNSNASVGKDCVSALILPLLSCSIPLNTGSATVDATNRLIVTGTGRATLANGGTYSFCAITMTGNSILQVPPGPNPTRIFIRDPQDPTCRDPSTGNPVAGAGSINVSGGARIVNCHLPTQPETLQIYAVGNPGVATTQTLAMSALSLSALTNVCGAASAGLGVPLTLIAPHSTIALGASTDIAGQVAGDRVDMTNAAKVTPVNALVNISRLGSNPVLPVYKATQYRECSGATFAKLPSASPAQGC